MIPSRITFFISISILLASTAAGQAPSQSYARQWRAVDSFVRRALPKSAMRVVDSICSEAKAGHDDVQFTRALIVRLRLQNLPAEKAFPAAVGELDESMAWAGRPARAILQNLAATLYWSYLQHNSYKILTRSNTVPFKNTDIETWTEANFRTKIIMLFEASLEDDTLLMNVREEDYSAILHEGNAHVLRPTLFDLMAHRALDYYINGEGDLDGEGKMGEGDMSQGGKHDTAAFTDARTFAEHPFPGADSGSLHYRALALFQRLIRLHLSDGRPDASIDVDIERLNWMRSWSVLEDKDLRYAAALEKLTGQWGEEPAAAEAWYQLASLHSNRASRYHSWRENRYDQWTDTTGRYEYLPAISACEKVASEKDSSIGKVHCRELLRDIREKKLSLIIEDNNLPGRPMRSMIVWRNCRTLYGRIIRVNPMKSGMRIEPYANYSWQRLRQLPAVRSFRQDLPITGDYQAHRTEIKIDALPEGKYLLIGSADSAFEIRGDTIPMAAVFFNVCRLTCIQNNRDGYVLDAESGKPVAGAIVKLWNAVSDQKTWQTIWKASVQQYRTDPEGHFREIAHHDGYEGDGYQGLEITAGKEHGFFAYGWNGGWSYSNEMNRQQDTTVYRETYLYTDRSIYRPGQAVYFKGIVVVRDPHTLQTRVTPKFRSKVFLIDVNGTLTDSMQLTTNEFGSYHGKFSLPLNRLSGAWTIQDSLTGSQETIEVAEYKRPRFYVQYDTVKAEYRVGDSIRILGFARSFAGNTLDGAEVRYRVERQVHFAYPCDHCAEMRSIGAAWGGWAPIRPDMGNAPEVMASGVSKVGAAGAFEVRFLATADRRIRPSEAPVFEYSVTADITDINGETQSGVSFVRAGYQSLALSIDQPEGDHLPADKLDRVVVDATNLSGVPRMVPVSVSIYSLRSPDRLIRERYWPTPDLFLLTKEEFIRLFPHDEYGDETRPGQWERGPRVFNAADSADSTDKDLAVRGPDGKSLATGWYVIEARATEEDGQVVKATRYVELYDGQTGRPANPQYVWPFPTEGTAEPGDTIWMSVGSSAADVHVIRTVTGEDSTGNLPFDQSRTGKEYACLKLDGQKLTSDYAVHEADRGGFTVVDIFVKDNRVFVQRYDVKVPWTNKELQISYSTYRNKVEPGSPEKWAVTIRSNRNDKVAAEVLAGMFDASLDQFRPHRWGVPAMPERRNVAPWQGGSGFGSAVAEERYVWSREEHTYDQEYDRLMEPYLGWAETKIQYTASRVVAGVGAFTSKAMAMPHAIQVPDYEKDPDGSTGIMKDTLVVEEPPNPAARNPIAVPARKNFQETAFFLPDLQTDSTGEVSFSFTMPETLTQWKWMTLAHTRDLAFCYSEKTVVTQKQLMVQPNAPRFLREGDKINLSVKVVNLTDSEMTGQVGLSLTDPTTGEMADGLFGNRGSTDSFRLPPRGNVVVNFPLDIPYQFNRPVSYRVVAAAGVGAGTGAGSQASAYSDGEEAVLPVVSNRIMVTETLPLNMTSDGMKTFRFEKLLKSDSSKTLNHHSLTVEFTANPAWYAVQALPYLMEYPYECAEQTFDRLYANALVSKIVGGSPRIAQVFERWKTVDTTALLSNLEKDPELKSILLEETPWVLEGKTETQQKKHIALLFDMVRMSGELGSTIDRLSELQETEGGFPWFKDGPDDRYITQYILTGMGRLQREKVLTGIRAGKIRSMVAAGLHYADRRIEKDYKAKSGLSESIIQYLYMRSYFQEVAIDSNAALAIRHYRRLARESWMKKPVHLQGMIALALFRAGDAATARSILASLRETAIHDEELGMYWGEMEGGYYWYQAPVETSAMMIEVFREIAHDTAADRELKTRLLRQKQTQHWATTKATADAVYALLAGNSDWLDRQRTVIVSLGEKRVEMAGEAGTGYDKKVFDAPSIGAAMGNINVSMTSANNGGSPAWGAVYWQYFDQLDRVTATQGGERAPLRVEKRLFIQRNTDRGPVLDTVPDKGMLHVGDRVVVRLVLRADRDMEYVHLKDMRGACLEPLNVLSGYEWQDGLGYYETSKDVSTEFFFSWVPRGTYVFEYTVVVDQTGEFSNGVASVECMYAPEFADHTEGIRVVSQ
jgi:hypothetical protein